MGLKYVMFNGAYPVVFGEYFSHDSVKTGMKATSAGQFSICPLQKTVTVYGKSLGLGIGPAEDDERILSKLFFPD